LCGIFGYTGPDDAPSLLIRGLKQLEYRGYDSAGVAVQSASGTLRVTRRAGGTESVARLEAALAELPFHGTTGIAHTRWATHGEVSERNAHPHSSSDGKVSIVHNGIVENYIELREELRRHGFKFSSDTDSEVIAHLVAHSMKSGKGLHEAVSEAMSRIDGAAAVVAVSELEPGKIVAARLGNAGGIVIGVTDGAHLVASDIVALLPYTSRVCYLESRQVVTLSANNFKVTDMDGNKVKSAVITTSRSYEAAQRGRFPHYMAKEIAEQPESVTAAMRQRVNFNTGRVDLPEFPLDAAGAATIQRAVFLGMGTSLHAAMTGATALETLARIPSIADNASELRYRDPVLDERTLVVAVTQSGETADTLAAMDLARASGALLVTIVEAEGTQATRLAAHTLPLRCGTEIGVASTKTMTATMVTLLLLAVKIGRLRGRLTPDSEEQIVRALAGLPGLVSRTLEQEPKIKKLASSLTGYNHLLYLGRGPGFPVAMEGALKMKEVAYIHAEGYAAGEMKHGVNALISEQMPTIAVVPHDELFDKMVTNVNEVKSRGGRVIALTTEGDTAMGSLADDVLICPSTHRLLQPVLNVVPLQLLAYHTAVALGHNPDKPRNLAKTVTVE
jgi:glucosamine--fructose-6-phosphate aminotransferase (isomerizing)